MGLNSFFQGEMIEKLQQQIKDLKTEMTQQAEEMIDLRNQLAEWFEVEPDEYSKRLQMEITKLRGENKDFKNEVQYWIKQHNKLYSRYVDQDEDVESSEEEESFKVACIVVPIHW